MTDLEPLARLPRRAGRKAPLADGSGDWALQSRTTVEHQIAEVLREKIIVGVIARGQKLKQAEIASMLGVSITPVREALRLLEAQGYVAVVAHRGAVVAPFVVEGAEELYRLRQVLETRLTLEAARRITPHDLDVLKAVNHDLLVAVRTQTRPTLQEKNFRFHFRFYELANQPQTIDFVRILWAKYPLDMLSTMPGRPMRVFEEHAALLAALERRDPDEAVRAMEAHIRTGWDEFRSNYAVPGTD
ncbi:GntR family transcriptional regulator [Labrys monachus]|uniref:DNA-binding GntR family transcriptional regulator n=1 Tax=Labrys monachus TaxID=217067 RepID=A0ABU0FG70_9HYPH|nr:GntR family transcriptional regulator [Labrys monachus]MDQ0393611.1 DNA-binding GntR family transcriptional regulator [Labrys monachus]